MTSTPANRPTITGWVTDSEQLLSLTVANHTDQIQGLRRWVDEHDNLEITCHRRSHEIRTGREVHWFEIQIIGMGSDLPPDWVIEQIPHLKRVVCPPTLTETGREGVFGYVDQSGLIEVHYLPGDAAALAALDLASDRIAGHISRQLEQEAF